MRNFRATASADISSNSGQSITKLLGTDPKNSPKNSGGFWGWDYYNGQGGPVVSAPEGWMKGYPGYIGYYEFFDVPKLSAKHFEVYMDLLKLSFPAN